MAGTHSVLADDQRILGIPRSRQTVAIIYPQYSSGLQDFPHTSVQAPCETEVTPSLSQCSARAAQDIWEHHRPAVGSSMHVLWNGHSTSEKLTLGLGRFDSRVHPARGCLRATHEGRPAHGQSYRYGPGASGRQRSHPLSESTRQITPPIRSGHAPPSNGSRKSSQSVHPDIVLTW